MTAKYFPVYFEKWDTQMEYHTIPLLINLDHASPGAECKSH